MTTDKKVAIYRFGTRFELVVDELSHFQIFEGEGNLPVAEGTESNGVLNIEEGHRIDAVILNGLENALIDEWVGFERYDGGKA